MQASGVVQVIRYNGKATNLQVDGVWYGAGFVAPDKLPCKEGDNVAFEFSVSPDGKFKNVNPRNITVTAGVPKSNATGNYPPPAGGRNNDVTQRQITWQASRNAAIEVAKLAKELDILPLGAKKNEQLANLQGFIHDLSVEFYAETEAVGKNGLDKFAAAGAQQESFE